MCGRVGFGSPTPSPSPSSYQREQRPRDHLAHRQLPGACVKPYALNQAGWQLYGKRQLAFAHRDWLFQLHNPLYRFHRWQTNLRVLEVAEIKAALRPTCASVRRAADRHNSARVLGSDPILGTADLEAKVLEFQHYYNAHRTHASLNGLLPELGLDGSKSPIRIGSYRWQKHCRGCI